MLKTFFVLIFMVIDLILADMNVYPTVTTEYGIIEGIKHVTTEGFETEMFLGIPYAKPPINELRFEKPQPPIPWITPLKAKQFGPQSVSFPDLGSPGSEDSLTLNIIKPSAPSDDSAGYPIMVWIHGGAFVIGSSAHYNLNETAQRIVSQGVIFISINYRLGPLGFFTTGTSEAPGNYGLWDQVEALKFIQKVIGAFGGNSKAVTIFGESAGGASVSWLTLTPETDGLFARAITMSGSALAPWAQGDFVVKTSSMLAEEIGCSNSANVKECLKGKTVEEIKEAATKVSKNVVKTEGVHIADFHPRVDGEFLHGLTVEEAFKRAPKTEHFMGICSQENVVFAIKGPFSDPNAKDIPINPEKAATYSRQDFIEIVHKILGTKEVYGSKAHAAAEDIIEYYESKISIYQRNTYLHLYAQLFGDIIFNIPTIREAQLKAAAGQKVFFYVYSFVPELAKHQFFDGAGHASELSNFFGSVYGMPAFPLEGDVGKVQKTIIDLFVNFAKTGKPTSDKLVVPSLNTPNTTPFIEINANSKISDNLWEDRIEFWDSHSKKYGFDWPQNQKIGKRDEL